MHLSLLLLWAWFALGFSLLLTAILSFGLCFFVFELVVVISYRKNIFSNKYPNPTIKTKKQNTCIKPAFRQYFMMQLSPQEHIRLTSLKSNCHFSFAKGGGPNTSVTLQMASLSKKVSVTF